MTPKFTKDYREKVEAYLAEGKPWKARDCLMGYFSQIKYDEELYRLTGRVFWALNDKPRAGLYWMMTTDDTPEVQEAIKIAIEEYGPNINRNLYVYVEPSKLPKGVRDRLREVFNESGVEKSDKIFTQDRFFKNKRAPQNDTIISQILVAGCFVTFFLVIIGLLGAAVKGLIYWIELIF